MNIDYLPSEINYELDRREEYVNHFTHMRTRETALNFRYKFY